MVEARIGDALPAGDPLAIVYGDASLAAATGTAFVIEDAPPPERPLIYGAIGSRTAAVTTATGARSTLASK
ncbi:MAG: hypothetical protein IAI50_03390 [Candidatus Eremiobacteraeota bacterium]|nr:hypothetical protein [Candidatus Eremiobacteraeota bacterium]